MIKKHLWAVACLFLFAPAILSAQTLSNPLGNNVTIEIVIGRVIRAILGLSGVAALLMFIWGGFLFLTSRGDTGQITKAKDTLKWAALGLFVIFFAYTLVNAVLSTFIEGTALNAPSNPN